MPFARAVLRTSLPLVALGLLALPRLLPDHAPGSAALVLAGQGRGAVSPFGAGRIVADGRPQPLAAPTRRTVAAAAPLLRPRQHPVRHVAPARPAARRTGAAPQVTLRDTYPYASDATWGSDPWGFTKRQCVSYVAWRLAEVGRPPDNATQGWGSALDWDDTAERLGRTVTARPRVGAVAQWNAGERSQYWSPGAPSSDGAYVAGPMGHVARVVQAYADGSVLVAQYNGTGDRSFSTMRVRAPRYLYL